MPSMGDNPLGLAQGNTRHIGCTITRHQFQNPLRASKLVLVAVESIKGAYSPAVSAAVCRKISSHWRGIYRGQPLHHHGGPLLARGARSADKCGYSCSKGQRPLPARHLATVVGVLCVGMFGDGKEGGGKGALHSARRVERTPQSNHKDEQAKISIACTNYSSAYVFPRPHLFTTVTCRYVWDGVVVPPSGRIA